jgi:transcriptional regulator with XRE-family HTH domain
MAKRINGPRIDVLAFLESRNKTQGWLADELGIAQSTLSDILRGRHTPSLQVAVELERITGVPVERFVRSA